MGLTRRSALKRIGMLLGAGGAVAAGIGLTREDGGSGETFSLQGRGWRLLTPTVARGQVQNGQQMLGHGLLFDAGGETELGSFTATYFGLPQAAGGGKLASLEQHVFTLAGGSLFGSGITAPGFGTTDEFAVVGGTGAYAGARGTYLVTQSPIEFGGDGSATITFRLMKDAVS